jgi:hypothetical protein
MAMSLLPLFIFYLIAFFAGVVFGSLALVPPLIIMCFGIPCTMELNQKGVLKSCVPMVHCIVSLVVLFSIFTVATWACYNFLLKGFGGYIAGILVTVIVGLYRCNKNRANLADRWRDPGKYSEPKLLIKASQLFLVDSQAPGAPAEPDLFSAVLRRLDYRDTIN